MNKMNEKDIELLVKSPAQKRYDYFVKKVVEEQKVWLLFGDSWAVSSTVDGNLVLPLWPDKEFAELCINEDWSEHKAVAVELDEVVENLLPQLKEKGILPGVFFTLDDGSVDVDCDELALELNKV